MGEARREPYHAVSLGANEPAHQGRVQAGDGIRHAQKMRRGSVERERTDL